MLNEGKKWLWSSNVIKAVNVAGLLAAAVAVTGCRSGEVYNEPYYDNNQRLTLTDFGVLDTQKRDSRYTTDNNLLINYLNNSGNFDLYWEANFSSDYKSTLFISQNPYASGGRQISYQECGFNRSCGFTGRAYCNYGANYRVSCDNQSSVDFGDWISPAPRHLYVVLELCDRRTLRCTEDSHEVNFY